MTKAALSTVQMPPFWLRNEDIYSRQAYLSLLLSPGQRTPDIMGVIPDFGKLSFAC